jgi:thiol-disulfide isomerase/thioredoxin
MPSRRGSTQQRIAREIVWILALASLPVLACRRGPAVPDGDIAATLTARTIDDHAFDPATLRGKPSLVLFVTPTCPHCLITLPRAAGAATAQGANLVAVFVSGKARNAAGVVSDIRFPGAVLIDDGTLLKRYAIKGVPYALVLGADGRARDVFEGEQEESTFVDALADAR